MGRAHWCLVILLVCIIGTPSAVRGEKRPPQSGQAELIGKLEEIDRAIDDVVVEFYQKTLASEEAERRLSPLMHTWLDLYLKFIKGRRNEILGRLELEFFDRINRDREPFIRAYSKYLLGDKEAVNADELILLGRIIDSVDFYAPPYPAASPPTPSSPRATEAGSTLPHAAGGSR